jgi:hypothetical protein
LKDESALSEISILPDGRVYLFGASRQLLEVLQAIPLGDPALEERISGLPQREADCQSAPLGLMEQREGIGR